jgi:hypothetical protein
MINDSIAHANDDIATRKWQEKVTQAQKLVDMIATVSDAGLKKHQNTLEKAIQTADYQHLSATIKAVEKALENHYQARLNESLKALFNEELAMEES